MPVKSLFSFIDLLMLLTHLITYIYIMLTKILKFKYIKKKPGYVFFFFD